MSDLGTRESSPPTRPGCYTARVRLATANRSHGRRYPVLGLLAVATAVLTWGWSNVASKTVPSTGLVISFYRLWFAVPVLWAVAIASPRVRSRLDRRWLGASLVGGLLFGVHQLLFFSSLKLTSVANVTIIGSLQPVIVLLVAGPMFGEVVARRALAWSPAALVGTALVVLGSHGTPGWSPRGDALAVLNLFAFTCYFLASKRIRADVRPTEYVIGMTTVAALFIGTVCLATGQDLTSPRSSDWQILVGLALVSGTLGHLLTNWAHAHVTAFVVSIMLLGTPVLASVGAAVFLDETLGPVQIVGGAIVLGAITTIVLSSRTEATAEELAESAAETDAP
jgi:drug/metabolite transporter (DMT)-like permease